jgi:hypothetical protein
VAWSNDNDRPAAWPLARCCRHRRVINHLLPSWRIEWGIVGPTAAMAGRP